jgi:hypothetical protein
MENQLPEESKAEKLIATFINKRMTELSRGRWAEEREWFESGLFYQQKQWLERSTDNQKKLVPVKISLDKKYPMPISDHFSKTINTNAGYLGSALPRMEALSDNYDTKNRRAAEAAENAIDAANKESGMNILNPQLALRVQLWGGWTKDSIAFDHSTDEVPDVQDQEPTPGPDGQMQEQQPQVVGIENVPAPRLDTELPMPFDVYIPRDCKDPNLSPLIIERVRKSKGKWKEIYPDTEFTKDDGKSDSDESLAGYYVNSLRSLSGITEAQNADQVTLTEAWFDWSELGEDEQEAVEAEWEPQPSQMYPQMSRLQAAVQYGFFAVIWKDEVVDWGENPWGDDKSGESIKPYTHFAGGKDPASPYAKTLAASLKPLQKQLNRYKSYAERSMLANGATRILWPKTQNGDLPTGDPADLIVYDPLGEGKVKPEIISGNMGDKGIFQMIEMVLSDFKDLGYTNEVAEGEMPGAGTAFRALAYLGSKAEESRKPQRYSWEQAHETRARKILRMAMKIWTNPRKIQTAGFNNKFGATQIAKADLQGDYQLDVVQDSSRPKTLTEKMEVLQQLATDGLVDMTDVSTRIYYTSTLGVQEIDLSDNLQYDKAERDLELCKESIKPQSNPYTNWMIHFKVFSDYTLTEEYESSPPDVQAGILAYSEWLQQMMQPPPPPPGGMPGLPPHPGGIQKQHKQTQAQIKKGGPGGAPASHVLGQVPGSQVSNTQVQHAAESEGNAVIPNEIGAN